jgi:hypothetical protein
MLNYHELDVGVRGQIWKHILHRARTSRGGAVIARKKMESLATTAFNGRQVSLLYGTSGDFFH